MPNSIFVNLFEFVLFQCFHNYLNIKDYLNETEDATEPVIFPAVVTASLTSELLDLS